MRPADDVRLRDIPGLAPKIIAGWLLVGVNLWAEYFTFFMARTGQAPPWQKLGLYVFLRAVGWMGMTWIIFSHLDRRPAVRMKLRTALLRVIPMVLGTIALDLAYNTLLVSTVSPWAPVRLSVAFTNLLASDFHETLLWVFLIVTVGHGIRFHYAKRALARAEFATLSSRIQPHFLFNALNSIAALVRTDAARAETMISRLGDLLRSSMADGGAERVTVAEEMHFVEQYLAIQRVRYADRLSVFLQVSHDAQSVPVPRFILQPLVENAVKHGIEPLATPGAVHVEAAMCGDGRLLLSVRNSAPPDPPLGRPEGLGLRLTRARLELLYGERQSFALERRGGMVVASIELRAA